MDAELCLLDEIMVARPINIYLIVTGCGLDDQNGHFWIAVSLAPKGTR
jgi:hypothetical protein